VALSSPQYCGDFPLGSMALCAARTFLPPRFSGENDRTVYYDVKEQFVGTKIQRWGKKKFKIY